MRKRQVLKLKRKNPDCILHPKNERKFNRFIMHRISKMLAKDFAESMHHAIMYGSCASSKTYAAATMNIPALKPIEYTAWFLDEAILSLQNGSDLRVVDPFKMDIFPDRNIIPALNINVTA